MNQDDNNSTNEAWDKNIPWDFIEKVALGEYREKFRGVSEDTFRFVADDSNRQAVINSALNRLKEIDPENASFEKAEVVADLFRAFAKVLVTDLDKHKL